MRPVSKSTWPTDQGGIRKLYKPHTRATGDLELDLDTYCSYCEVFSSDLEVEHVISQDQDSSLANDWDNFLLACGRCNGRGNKGNKHVELSTIHFPHINNTLLSFTYLEGGVVTVNKALKGNSRARAIALLDLVGLDKIPGSPKYTNSNDTRWRHRRTAWEFAVKYLPEYETGNLTAQQIVDFASQKGFFSVWFTVFENHSPVRQLLIQTFKGTAQNCFDPTHGYMPMNRNPTNASDPI